MEGGIAHVPIEAYVAGIASRKLQLWHDLINRKPHRSCNRKPQQSYPLKGGVT